MRIAIARSPTREANVDDTELRTVKVFPAPVATNSFGGSSSIGFMQFRNTSGFASTPVSFPLAANIVIRGVISVANKGSPRLGKVAILWTSYVLLLVGLQPSSCRADGLPGPVMAGSC